MPDSDLNRMNGVIADFCTAVVTEPLCCFSEADLQGLLFARLIAAFPQQNETAYARGPGAKSKFRTGIVHREYGAEDRRRTDISVFSRDDVAAIDNPNLTIEGNYIKPRFAVELGTEKTLDTHAHVMNDLQKLSRVSERGYLIHFFRDNTRAEPGTPARARTEDKLRRIFKVPVSKADPSASVICLCFLVRVARSGTNVRGRCEMLEHGTGVWRKVNATSVRAKVFVLLSAQTTSPKNSPQETKKSERQQTTH